MAPMGPFSFGVSSGAVEGQDAEDVRADHGGFSSDVFTGFIFPSTFFLLFLHRMYSCTITSDVILTVIGMRIL